VGSGPFSVATTDFNNDGFLDLAVVNDDVDTLSVLLGNGDGTFQTQTVYPTGFQVEFVTTGDLDGDGSDDIAVANFGESTVGVYYNNGDGSFHDPVTFPVGGNDSGLAIGDVNGDGRPDIVASYFHPSKVGVLKNTGTSFSPVVDFGTGQTQGFELTLADLNGDGTPDVVSDDIIASFSVLLNVTAAVAKVTNVAVPGSKNDTAAVVATYSGDQRYKSSQSQPVKVHGSGAK
jgi:hypothetical protein